MQASATLRTGRATAVRWKIAGLLLMVVTLTFIDRFNMNVAAKYIQGEFELSNVQIGSLLSAFVLGYGLFQAPGGRLGDRYGARRVLLGAIVWWSLFTAFTGRAGAPTDRDRYRGLVLGGSFSDRRGRGTRPAQREQNDRPLDGR